MNNELVSIIIPVYNVEKYLDKCLESVVNQSYKHIEIILINDGSTDSSLQKCWNWQKADGRIVVIDKNNEGLSKTRNLGIKIAKGAYIAFIDSDDWVEDTFIESMYKQLKQSGADMVECDFQKVYFGSGINSYSENNSMMGLDFNIEQRLLLGSPTMWKIFSKKSLWIDNGITMPTCTGEDIPTYAMLLFMSRSVGSCQKSLYYYRKNRPGSITYDASSYIEVPKAIRYLIDYLRKKKRYDNNKYLIYRYSMRWLAKYLTPGMVKLNSADFQKLFCQYSSFLESEFNSFYQHINLAIFGSYNLTRIVNKLSFLENPNNRFQFSSIIAIMSSKSEKLRCMQHHNAYRMKMLQREAQNTFFRFIDKQKISYLVIDFIEERHDIAEIDRFYYTNSDAFQETNLVPDRLIARNSDECAKLWQEKCLLFIEQLKKRFKPQNVVLVKNYLSECYGNIHCKKQYADINKIRAINEILEGYYAFFAQNYAGIQIIDMHTDALYMTDENFEYGCYPWHLNDWINTKIAHSIVL